MVRVRMQHTDVKESEMQPSELWTSNTKFVEYGLRDGTVGAWLCAHGFGNYLGVARTKSTLKAIATGHSTITACLAQTNVRSAVRKNNADVLILSGLAAWNLIRFRQLRHAKYVVWRPSFGIAVPLALVGWLVNRLLGRFASAQMVVLSQDSRPACRLIVFRLLRRKKSLETRRYIPHRAGVDGFLDWMMRESVPHAVLRWFETLPMLEPGEDVDLLVADDALDQVGEFLNRGPGIVPCDLYSATGLPGSDFRGMPYFPPYLAESLLADAVVHRNLCRVPSPRHHFLSMVFHALYHKGYSAGLSHAGGSEKESRNPEHDYATVLSKLAEQIEADVEITMEQLDQHLQAEGWRPPHDYLVRLAKRNEWIRTIVDQHRSEAEDPGLAVFIIRREAVVRNRLDLVIQTLQDQGFSLVDTKEFDNDESRVVAHSIRGGNWGRGPWKTSGGPPAAAVVMYDTTPVTPTPRQKMRLPHVTNARLLCKKLIRAAFNKLDPTEMHCNVVHSSDNGHEALDYIAITMPERTRAIRDRVEAIRDAFETREPVLKTLTRGGRRAKIELIEFDGQPAVKKTFKISQDRFRQREVTAMAELSKQVPEIPRLILVEDNAVVMPYYTGAVPYKRSSGKLLPLSVAKQAMAALRGIYDAGYALIDASADNILVDRDEGLKLIDFEFLYQYEQKPATFEQSYDVAGCPDDFPGDIPNGGSKSYDRNWRPYVGLSLESLLNDPTWLQHVKRCSYYIAHLPRLLPRRLRFYFRSTVATLVAMSNTLKRGRSHEGEHTSEILVYEQSEDVDSPRERKAA